MGLLVFLILVYFENGSFSPKMDTNDIYIYLVPIAAMIGYFGSKLVFQNLIKNLPASEPIPKKLQRYYVASLLKYVFIEAPAFLALFAYLSNGNAMYLVIGLSLMLYLFFQRPKQEQLINELPLNLEEKKEFNIL